MRVALAMMWVASSVFGCSCAGPPSACSEMGTSAILFVARVAAKGERTKQRNTHVVIEEALQNVPKELQEVDIDNNIGSSCHYPLEPGERYVIVTDSSYRIIACSTTFKVKGNEHVLEALRNQVKGGPARIVGTVRRREVLFSRTNQPLAGVLVTAEIDGTSRKSTTDAYGRYEFLGLSPGRYTLKVSKDRFAPDDNFALNAKTGMLEHTVLVDAKSCVAWDADMWAEGSIVGVVRGLDGQALSGISVQAFAAEGDKTRSWPDRVAASGSDGSYSLGPLPEGDYLVGLKSADGQVNFTRVHVGESQEIKGVDLILH